MKTTVSAIDPHINSPLPVAAGRLGSAYTRKPAHYFSGARTAFVADLPDNPGARVLEIGCSEGATGALAIALNKCSLYCGVEISATPLTKARERLHEVIHADVESAELPWPASYFDSILLSEVLEHLVDPWATLRKLRVLLKSGGQIYAGSPNVAHYRTILMLLRGDWSLEDMGPMDRTHLRWFTPKTYAAMFEATGYDVLKVSAIGADGLKARLASALLLGQCNWLWARQIYVHARRSD